MDFELALLREILAAIQVGNAISLACQQYLKDIDIELQAQGVSLEGIEKSNQAILDAIQGPQATFATLVITPNRKETS